MIVAEHTHYYNDWRGQPRTYEAESLVVPTLVIPLPKNQWQGFWYHYHLGRLVRIPRIPCVIFSWKYRKSWMDGHHSDCACGVC